MADTLVIGGNTVLVGGADIDFGGGGGGGDSGALTGAATGALTAAAVAIKAGVVAGTAAAAGSFVGETTGGSSAVGLVFADRVMQTTTTIGVGDVTPSGTIPGYQALSAALTDGDLIPYLIYAVDGRGAPSGDWETGRGTWNAGVVERTSPIDGSTATPVNFAAGTKHIAVVILGDTLRELSLPAEQRGALVKKTADQTGADYTTATAVVWGAEVYDSDDIHNTSTNPTRLTVPLGIAQVRLRANVEVVSIAADTWASLYTQKNGAAFDGQASTTVETGKTTASLNCGTATIAVAPGDYFELLLQTEDSAVDVVAAGSWFAMELIA